MWWKKNVKKRQGGGRAEKRKEKDGKIHMLMVENEDSLAEREINSSDKGKMRQRLGRDKTDKDKSGEKEEDWERRNERETKSDEKMSQNDEN